MNKLPRYDILNVAKSKGQPALIELPRISRKDQPRSRVRAELAKQRIQEVIDDEGKFYDYTLEHPELCPPVGTVFYIQNQYGVKAKLTVKMVFRGLPGTSFELLPMSEQPEHLRDSQILTEHIGRAGRPGWVQWADRDAWERYQRQQGRSLRPWEEEHAPWEGIIDLIPEIMAGQTKVR